MGSDSTYLIDMDGQIVHRWLLQGLKQAIYAQLLPDGRLLAMATDASTPVPAPLPPNEIPAFEQHVRRIGGNANRLVEYDWDGNELWHYENAYMHHDFVRLANGNTLVTEFTELERAFAATVQGGMPVELPHLVADDLVEVDKSGKELRRVYLWQLLDPVADPRCPIERLASWTHVNSLAVTPAGDILFSARMISRIGLVSPEGQLTWKYGGDLGHQHHAADRKNKRTFATTTVWITQSDGSGKVVYPACSLRLPSSTFCLYTEQMSSIVAGNFSHFRSLPAVRGGSYGASGGHLRTSGSQQHGALPCDRGAPGDLSRLVRG
jgi:hypothetical protein